MQITDQAGLTLAPKVPAGDNLVIKRCPNATINLHGQTIAGSLNIQDSPGIRIVASGASPCRVVANGSSAQLVSVCNSPDAKISYVYTYGHPSLLSRVQNYLALTEAAWLATPNGIMDYHGGIDIYRCRAHGVQIGFVSKGNGSVIECQAHGMWGDGIRALGPNLTIKGNKVYDLFDVSDLHPDLIQSYQDVGATVPWDNIVITDNDLNAWYTTAEAGVPRAKAQGIFCGRGPYGVDILIARNRINQHAYRAISVPDGVDVRIEDNTVVHQYPGDGRYPFIQNYAKGGAVLRNVTPAVKVCAPGVMVAANTAADGVTASRMT